MALSNADKAALQRCRTGGGAPLVTLDDAASTYLVGVVARDLALDVLDGAPDLPELLGVEKPVDLRLPGFDFLSAYERLLEGDPNANSYFCCLAKLLISRIKFELILEAQPLPTIDQVGPRGLLQFGSLNAEALAGLLFWRKWLYDVDNRAAQETGYLFEPVIANAIGGVPYGAARSPIRRQGDPTRGRQVDCVRDRDAYEIKLRVTIAASGQGRWAEELEFPEDCRASGYRPILIVLDPTPSGKLADLRQAFVDAGGLEYVGENAWKHLVERAGETMGAFLRKYVRDPIEALLEAAPVLPPNLTLKMAEDEFVAQVGSEVLRVRRRPAPGLAAPNEALPADVDEA